MHYLCASPVIAKGLFQFNENLDRDQFQVIIGRYVYRSNSWQQDIVGEIVFEGDPFFQELNTSSIFPGNITHM